MLKRRLYSHLGLDQATLVVVVSRSFASVCRSHARTHNDCGVASPPLLGDVKSLCSSSRELQVSYGCRLRCCGWLRAFVQVRCCGNVCSYWHATLL